MGVALVDFHGCFNFFSLTYFCFLRLSQTFCLSKNVCTKSRMKKRRNIEKERSRRQMYSEICIGFAVERDIHTLRQTYGQIHCTKSHKLSQHDALT